MYDIKKFSVPKHYIRPFYSPAIVAILFAFVKKSYPFAMPSLNYPLLLLLFEIQSLSLNACFWIKKAFYITFKITYFAQWQTHNISLSCESYILSIAALFYLYFQSIFLMRFACQRIITKIC